MPTFDYQALDAKGKKTRGHVSADSERLAREVLRKRDLTPLSLSQATRAADKQAKPGTISLRLFRSKIAILDLMVFTRQLATLMGSGMPLEQSLRLMTENTERRSLTGAIVQLRTMITEGFSLANALERTSLVFPLDYIATIAAGEESGKLSQVLNRLADDLEQQTKARQSLSSALIYPVMLVIVCLVIVVVLMVSVVPRVTRVFEEQNQELPRLTSIMIGVSNFLTEYGIYMLWALACMLIVFLLMMRKEEFRYRVHKRLTELPVMGYWIRIGNAVRWARSLGILLASGVPSLQALRLACNGVQNLHIREQLRMASDRVREGSSLSQALKDYQCMPQFLIQMVASGESSANLDEMLVRASDYYTQTLRMTVESSLKIFEPMLILVMGGLVLMIVLSVLLPIFGINQLIQ